MTVEFDCDDQAAIRPRMARAWRITFGDVSFDKDGSHVNAITVHGESRDGLDHKHVWFPPPG